MNQSDYVLTSAPSELVTEVMLLPDGMQLDDINRHAFAVVVRWRGPRTATGRGGYAITHANRHLSHNRWVELASALVSARAVVNDIRVMGKTWAEWQASCSTTTNGGTR